MSQPVENKFLLLKILRRGKRWLISKGWSSEEKVVSIILAQELFS